MQRTRIEDIESRKSPASVRRSLSGALGAEDVSINYFELEPGESFAFGYHRHDGQEEVFYLLEGEATFETGEPRSGSESGSSAERTRSGDGEAANEEVTVSAGEAVRFGPGEWQQGWNRGETRVKALALGAPQESGETVVLRECSECGDRTDQEFGRAEDADALVTRCADCGTETGRFT